MSDPGELSTVKAKKFRRISVNTFLLGLLVPVILLISLLYLDIIANLNVIENKAQQTSNEHLPNILAGQRSVLNLEKLRRFAEQAYSAKDPVTRRIATINATALTAEAVFEDYEKFADNAPQAQLLIRQISEVKNRGETLWEQVLQGEIKLSASLGALYSVAGLEGEPPFALRDHQRDSAINSDEQVLARLAEMQTSMQPALAVCQTSDSNPDQKVTALCAEISDNFAQIREDWLAHADFERQAFAAWSELDDMLSLMSDTISTAEAEVTYHALRSIGDEVDSVRLATLLSLAFLIVMLISLGVIVHHYILQPISTAATSIKRMRFGKAPDSLQPVRIKELQELLDLLPDLSNHMRELNALSNKLEEEKDKYVSMSYVDGMTGVNNRRSFDNHIKHENRMSAVSVLMLDVDMFKLYNDTLGHQAGDQALIAVAKAIEGTLMRSTDRVFRYGGEEFAVILPDASEDAAISVAQRIILNIQELNIPHPASTVAPFLTVSIGVSTRSTGENIDYTELVARADKALYKAKQSGRNQVRPYRPGDAAPPEK